MYQIQKYEKKRNIDCTKVTTVNIAEHFMM